VSRDRAFAFALLLKKLAVPMGMLALLGAGAVSSAGCSSTSTPGQTTGTGGADGRGGGGAGSTSITTSTGGCTTAEQCPGTDTDCRKRSCAAGVCGFEDAPAGVATSAQTAGDCQASVCDGMGATTTQGDDTDVLDDKNDCTDDVCVEGAPVNKPRASGAACASGGGKVCDGASKCVECVDAAGCATGVCSQSSCVPASCLDAVKNDKETDVDCGGPDCNPCADGKICVVGPDCVDTICTGGLCAKATCADAAKNGGETDVDCGGGLCDGCGPDLGCKVDADCVGGSCSGTTCLPTCTDAVKDSGETDVDCGGPTCGVCADGKACAVAADCKSKVCSGGACQIASCTDGAKNGAESDVDCGGPCGPCAPTQACNGPADCATSVCTGKVCQGAVCNDGAKNGTESDVDCGGLCATKCAAGKACGAGGDCASLVCAGGVCKGSFCGDGVQNGAEACDDGNALSGDGCSATCAIEAGFTCVGAAPTVCKATCGDGIQAGPEQCDDGNTTTGDGCSSACAVEIGFDCSGSPSVCLTTCGDGKKASSEACDDGNGIPNDGCTACAINAGFTCVGTSPSVCKATCGDGIKAGAEQCDDGNTAAGDGCSATCTVQSGFVCTGAAPSVCATTCGDGVQAGPEQCDDNNNASGDCCSAQCKIEAGCELEINDASATANDFAALQVGGKINGFIKTIGDRDFYAFVVPAKAIGKITATTVNNFLGIACTSNTIDTLITLYTAAATSVTSNDDVNATTNYCSTITAASLVPGTYYVAVEASTLASLKTFAYTLQADLQLAICGNGVVEAPEQCDMGPNCAADCTLIPVCGDGNVTGAEACDDGNVVSGDGCSATCTWETVAEVEPNDTTANANANAPVAGTTMLSGTFASATDKDTFKVNVATAGVIRFEVFDSTGHDCTTMPTSTLALLNSAGTVITQDTTSSEIVIQGGIKTCAALVVYVAPGSYYLQAAAGAVGTYLLQARFEANAGNEVEPNDTQATATALPGKDTFIYGGHQSASDTDYFAITVPSGNSIRAEVVEGDTIETCESLEVDSLLTLFNASAVSLVTDDDDGRGYCSGIDGTGATPRDSGAHNLTAGTYYLQLKSSTLATATQAQFNYRLALTVR
jgi:cysteine-rich repeat protein